MLHVSPFLVRLSDINGYSEEAAAGKQFFHTEGKKFLTQVAKAVGIPAGTFEIRSNKAGPAVSGEVTLHSDTLYVQLSESYTHDGISILFRVCRGRQDYSGGQNHFTTLRHLFNSPQLLERFIETLKQLGGFA